MGTGSSVQSKPPKASKKILSSKLEQEQERKYESTGETEEQMARQRLEFDAQLAELKSRNEQLEDSMHRMRTQMKLEAERWQQEKGDTLHMMFSELPLMHLTQQARWTKISTSMFSGSSDKLCKTFPMVTIATWDIVGFADLCTKITPAEVVSLLDKLYARVDEVFSDRSIVILERLSDSCTAVSGLVEQYYCPSPPEKKPLIQKTDSTYGSVDDLKSQISADEIEQSEDAAEILPNEQPENYTAILASSSLRLMSCITPIKVSNRRDSILQLRIALHSGSCSAGAIGLHSVHHIPKYRLFGPTVTRAHWLRSSGLALQIRVSSQSKALLERKGGFRFERCPDCRLHSRDEIVESYWLVGMDAQDIKLPSLERAIPLTSYSV